LFFKEEILIEIRLNKPIHSSRDGLPSYTSLMIGIDKDFVLVAIEESHGMQPPWLSVWSLDQYNAY
jgi:hypothetical protein